jgi:hypothetical protein
MAGELGENLRERLPRILARGDGDQFRVRMVEQQLHQFFAGVTRRADNGDFLRFHLSKNLTVKPMDYTQIKNPPALASGF